MQNLNRPLASSENPHFQNEARCTTFLVKMSVICMRMKNDFHIKGWAPTLVLKQRPEGTRKWPIQGNHLQMWDKNNVALLVPCGGIQEIPGFWTPRWGFLVSRTWIAECNLNHQETNSWPPTPLSCIQQLEIAFNFLDSLLCFLYCEKSLILG